MATFLHHTIGALCIPTAKQEEFSVSDTPVRVIGIQLPVGASIAIEQRLSAPCVTKVGANGVALCGSLPREYWVPVSSPCGGVRLDPNYPETLIVYPGTYRINKSTLPAGAYAVWAGEATNLKGRVGVSLSAPPCPGPEPVCDVTPSLGITGWSP
jgi:hypothetical protein